MNVEIGTEAAHAVPCKGIHKWEFRCSDLYLFRHGMMICDGQTKGSSLDVGREESADDERREDDP